VTAPHLHIPRLVRSSDLKGDGVLERVADVVGAIVGDMRVFSVVTIGIVVWLFAGNILAFDRTPWPLLLVVLNLPQLSIMISLQVSANRAEKQRDAKAETDHETLGAILAIVKGLERPADRAPT
jgi:uncharacterized membrane protein